MHPHISQHQIITLTQTQRNLLIKLNQSKRIYSFLNIYRKCFLCNHIEISVIGKFTP